MLIAVTVDPRQGVQVFDGTIQRRVAFYQFQLTVTQGNSGGGWYALFCPCHHGALAGDGPAVGTGGSGQATVAVGGGGLFQAQVVGFEKLPGFRGYFAQRFIALVALDQQGQPVTFRRFFDALFPAMQGGSGDTVVRPYLGFCLFAGEAAVA